MHLAKNTNDFILNTDRCIVVMEIAIVSVVTPMYGHVVVYTCKSLCVIFNS